jgi:hypothetical protein
MGDGTTLIDQPMLRFHRLGLIVGAGMSAARPAFPYASCHRIAGGTRQRLGCSPIPSAQVEGIIVRTSHGAPASRG